MRQGIIIDLKIMPQDIMSKDIFHSSLGTINPVHLWQNSYATGYSAGALFMRQGTRCGAVFHTPPPHPLSSTPGVCVHNADLI